jgi:hypothetical protein
MPMPLRRDAVTCPGVEWNMKCGGSATDPGATDHKKSIALFLPRGGPSLL